MKNITSKMLELLLENKQLENLDIIYKRNKVDDTNIFKCKYVIPLDYLFDKILKPNFAMGNINIDQIVSVCLFGSVLYRHIPIPFTTIEHVKLKNGSPKVCYTREYLPRPWPKDIDIAIITKFPITRKDGQVSTFGQKFDWHKCQGCYGSSSYRVKENIFPIELHYRSVAEFYDGIAQGDTWCSYVAQFGIPLMGQLEFYKLLTEMTGNVRKDMHQIKWTVDKTIWSATCKAKFCFNKLDKKNEEMGISEEAVKRIEAVSGEMKSRFDLMDLEK